MMSVKKQDVTVVVRVVTLRAPTDEEYRWLERVRAVAYELPWKWLTEGMLKLVPVAAEGLQTVGVTRGMLLLFDHAWCVGVRQWPLLESAWALYHEVSHIALQHLHRGEEFPPDVRNMAGDLVINQMIHDAGGRLPQGYDLVPEMFGFPPGLTLEEYARLLMEKFPPIGCGDGDGEGGSGDGEGRPGSEPGAGWCGSGAGRALPGEPDPGSDEAQGLGARSEADVERTVERMAEEVRSAAAKQAGSVPEGWLRWAEAMAKPVRIPWHAVLPVLVRQAKSFRRGMADWTYTRPSRRQAAVGWGFGKPVLPGLHAPEPRLGVCADTSGSMGDAEGAVVFGTIDAILRSAGVRELDIVACDAAVHEARPVKSLAQAAALMRGGGGTDMQPGLDELERRGCDLAIVVTDGCLFGEPKEPARMRVIWVLAGELAQKPCDWGEVLWVR